jgi:SdpC family antimicrobial peptide
MFLGSRTHRFPEDFDMKRLMALLLVASTVLAGCSTSQSGDPTASSAEIASYSGEELYTGIIFGYGRASGLLPTVSNYVDQSVAVSPAQRQRIDGVIADIKASNPEFFSQFSRDIQSGDHVVIRAALESAMKTTAETTERLGKASKEAAASTEVSENARRIDPAVDIETFIYAVFVVIAFWIDFNVTQGAADDGLVLDALTDDIAALTAN